MEPNMIVWRGVRPTPNVEWIPVNNKPYGGAPWSLKSQGSGTGTFYTVPANKELYLIRGCWVLTYQTNEVCGIECLNVGGTNIDTICYFWVHTGGTFSDRFDYITPMRLVEGDYIRVWKTSSSFRWSLGAFGYLIDV